MRRRNKTRHRTLSRRQWSSTKGVTGFSDRSGMPFKYDQMVVEPDTGHWVHKSESDGQWNITQAYRDPVVPSDAQKLEHGRNIPSGAIEPAVGLYLYEDGTEDADILYIDNAEQEALEGGV